jgi:hypothetical protein
MNFKILDTLLKSVGGVINNLVCSSQDKEKLKSELTTTILSHYDQVYNLQKEIIVSETRGNWLQRSWRPIVMLAFAFVVLLGVFIEIPLLNDNSPFWSLLELGMGGYVIGRSAEKISCRVIDKIKK